MSEPVTLDDVLDDVSDRLRATLEHRVASKLGIAPEEAGSVVLAPGPVSKAPSGPLARKILLRESELRANPLGVIQDIHRMNGSILNVLAAEIAGVKGEPAPKAYLPGVAELAQAAAENGAHTPLWTTWRTTVTLAEPTREGDRFALWIESSVDCLPPEMGADACDVLAAAVEGRPS